MCELVGIFILSHLTQMPGYTEIWFECTKNGQQADRVRKNIVQVLENFGFKIEIETILIENDFLAVTFSLIKGTFRLCKKLNNNLSYRNVSSNHF